MAIKDPFARKMVLGSLAFGAVLIVMFAILTTVYLHLRPKCSEEVVSESPSPDRQWVATAMQRRCGEEALCVTHINLRPADHPIRYGFFSGKAEHGEIFAIEQDAQALHLVLLWDSPGQLIIHCRNCANSGKRQERWDNLLIRYAMIAE